jgi:7-cyano-7-deazaguanine synthase
MKKAIVLFSGGLDSTTVLAMAKKSGFKIYALSFSYGQRHKVELESAKKIAKTLNVFEHKIAEINLRIFGHSALTSDIAVPKDRDISQIKTESQSGLNLNEHIPITYVPARNTIFLSYALAYAEVVGAFDIFIGANAIDYSGYPDCRPKFIKAFEDLANLAIAAVPSSSASAEFQNNHIKINAPLIDMSKKEIIETGISLGVDYSKTHSCYDPIVKGDTTYSCGHCDSCKLRIDGFKAAGIEDPLVYF